MVRDFLSWVIYYIDKIIFINIDKNYAGKAISGKAISGKAISGKAISGKAILVKLF